MAQERPSTSKTKRVLFALITLLFVGLPGLGLAVWGVWVLAWPGGYGCGEYGRAYAFMSAFPALVCGLPLALYPIYIYRQAYGTGTFVRKLALAFVLTAILVIIILTLAGPPECPPFEPIG